MQTDYFLTQFYNVEINGLEKALRNFWAGIELWCAPIHHGSHRPCITLPLETFQNTNPPSVSDKAQGNLFYDFLYNLHSASAWAEHFPLSLEGGKESVFNAFIKYIAASVVTISSWQVTGIYRREGNSLKLVSLQCGFFPSLLIACILISSSECRQLSLSL